MRVLSSQKCMTQPTFTNSYHYKYSQDIHDVQIEVLEVLMFLMIYLIEIVFQIKQKI